MHFQHSLSDWFKLLAVRSGRTRGVIIWRNTKALLGSIQSISSGSELQNALKMRTIQALQRLTRQPAQGRAIKAIR